MKTIFEENAEDIWKAGEKDGLFNGLKLKNGTIVNNYLRFGEYLSEIDSNNPLFNFVVAK